MDLGPCTEAQG